MDDDEKFLEYCEYHTMKSTNDTIIEKARILWVTLDGRIAFIIDKCRRMINGDR
jgi:hypothetical protein